jgi:hypothetical protein
MSPATQLGSVEEVPADQQKKFGDFLRDLKNEGAEEIPCKIDLK